MKRASWTLVVIGLAISGLAPAAAAEGQQRQQRATPGQQGPPPPDAAARRELLDRFAQRVSQALDLDQGEASRLATELERSQAERERIARRRGLIRRELNQLVRAPVPEDDARIGELLDEFASLALDEAQLAVAEQERLSSFLTPVQRARLMYLRQRLAQQALERRRNANPDRPPPPGDASSSPPQERGVQQRSDPGSH